MGFQFCFCIHKPLTYFVWFVAFLCTLSSVISSLFSVHLANIHLLLSVGAVLAFGWFLLSWNTQVVQNMMKMSLNHQISLSPGKLDLLSKLATISIVFVMIFLLMDVTGRNMQTLIAFAESED